MNMCFNLVVSLYCRCIMRIEPSLRLFLLFLNFFGIRWGYPHLFHFSSDFVLFCCHFVLTRVIPCCVSIPCNIVLLCYCVYFVVFAFFSTFFRPILDFAHPCSYFLIFLAISSVLALFIR